MMIRLLPSYLCFCILMTIKVNSNNTYLTVTIKNFFFKWRQQQQQSVLNLFQPSYQRTLFSQTHTHTNYCCYPAPGLTVCTVSLYAAGAPLAMCLAASF